MMNKVIFKRLSLISLMIVYSISWAGQLDTYTNIDLNYSGDTTRFKKEQSYLHSVMIQADDEVVFLSIKIDDSDFDALFHDCEYRNSHDQLALCDWRVTVVNEECDPALLYSDDVSDRILCTPQLIIRNDPSQGNHFVAVCPRGGYQMTGFFTFRYLQSHFGQTFYEAHPVFPQDSAKAWRTFTQFSSDPCFPEAH